MNGARPPGGHLSEDQVMEAIGSFYPDMCRWMARMSEPWQPEEDSDLDDDNRLAGGPQNSAPSYLARMSLIIGTENAFSAFEYSHARLTMFSAKTLLRTSIVGAAQAIWLMSPSDQRERLARAKRLARHSHFLQRQWTNEVAVESGMAVDPAELDRVRSDLTRLIGDGKPEKLDTTGMIREAATYCNPNPESVGGAMGEWRSLSAVVHALPWELNIRPETEEWRTETQYVTSHAPSWSQLQGASSLAYALLQEGWKLLDSRGARVS